MATGSAERGFTYLAMLLAVAVVGIGLAAAGTRWTTAAQREREAELLFIGGEFRRAIRSYVLASPGVQRYPRRLQDLLADERFPSTRRHLRRIYRDPLTGTREWGLVQAPGGAIMGVYSLSEATPFKTSGFRDENRTFEGARQLSGWKFVHAPPGP
jgi:type II secretory pathway pseudopilin PulG